MNDIDRIKTEIKQLSLLERRELVTWIDQHLEDGLQFTPDFEARIKQSEKEMEEGIRPRTRSPKK